MGFLSEQVEKLVEEHGSPEKAIHVLKQRLNIIVDLKSELERTFLNHAAEYNDKIKENNGHNMILNLLIKELEQFPGKEANKNLDAVQQLVKHYNPNQTLEEVTSSIVDDLISK